MKTKLVTPDKENTKTVAKYTSLMFQKSKKHVNNKLFHCFHINYSIL